MQRTLEEMGQPRRRSGHDEQQDNEYRLESIQEAVGTAEGGVQVGRGGRQRGHEMARGRASVASAPVSPAERRRNSILGPLSPSVSFQMERHLEQQFSRPPHIDVKYLTRCKSLSYCPAGGRRRSCVDPDTGDDDARRRRGKERASDNNNAYRIRYTGHPLFSPSLPQRTATTTTTAAATTTATMIALDNQEHDDDNLTEFGVDLFQRRYSSASIGSSDNDGLDPLSRFQQQVERLVATGEPPQLTMPPHAYRHHHLPPVTESGKPSGGGAQEKGRGNKKQQGPDLQLSCLKDLPPIYPNSRPPFSPMRKNPLSAASSPATSRVTSRSNSLTHLQLIDICAAATTTTTHQNHDGETSHQSDPATPAPYHHHPLQPSEQHQTVLNQNQTNANKGSTLYGNINGDKDPKDVYQYNVDVDIEPPAESSTILGLVPNDQDCWRSSSALSALTTPSSSSSLSSPTETVMMAMTMPPRGLTMVPRVDKTRHGKVTSFKQEEAIDMRVEIPLIESHDEVSLYDIWRMEDEERRDRINGQQQIQDQSGDDVVGTSGVENGGGGGGGEEPKSIRDHIAHMKGKQHAHIEARLIQEAMRSSEH